MNVRDFERLLATHGLHRASLDAITRHLRAMKLLPVGGRGPNAPAITAEGAALVLLVVAGVSNPNSSDQVECFLSEFGCKPGEPLQPNAARDFLTYVVSDPANAASVKEIRVSRDTADVTVYFEDGRIETYRALSEEDLLTRGAERPGGELEYTLRQSLLIRAASALRPQDREA